MVSRKCWSLLSRGSAWAKAAWGTPPEVGLEPLRPSRPLSTSTTSMLRLDASSAAMHAARPPPMMRTSQSVVGMESLMCLTEGPASASAAAFFFLGRSTTSTASSGQTSSHRKQFTQYLLPKGKTLSFLLVKRNTSAPQS